MRGDRRYDFRCRHRHDIITGGDKVIPETVSGVVNYRIALHDSLDIVKSEVARLLEPIARKHNVKVEGFGRESGAERRDGGSDNQEATSPFGSLYPNSLNDLSRSPIALTDIQTPSGTSSAVPSAKSSKTPRDLRARKSFPLVSLCKTIQIPSNTGT